MKLGECLDLGLLLMFLGVGIYGNYLKTKVRQYGFQCDSDGSDDKVSSGGLPPDSARESSSARPSLRSRDPNSE